MRELLICLLGILPLVAVTAAPVPLKSDSPAKALEKDPRLPVWIWAAGQQIANVETSLPMIAVGRIPHEFKPARMDDDIQCWQRPLPVLRPGDLLESYWKGQMVPAPPQSGHATTLFLVGPVLGGGQAWGPARLTRDGQTFTLLLESWTDDAPRLRNVIYRALYALDLGQLPVGEYDLQILWRGLFAETNQTAPLYRLQSVKTGQVRFNVSRAAAAPKPAEGLGHPATLQETDFRPAAVPAEESKRLRQRPISWVRYLSTEGNFNALPASGLYASPFDLPKWLASSPKNLGQLPPLQAPVANQPTLAVLLGPPLNTGEWLTLREIEWREKQAILRVDLWRDNGPRLQNQASCPVLVAPLWSWGRPLLTGDYTVQIEWSFLRAATNREPYRTEAPAELAKTPQVRSKVEFTLK